MRSASLVQSDRFCVPSFPRGWFAIADSTELPADLLAGMPADLWAALPVLHPIYVVVGALATAIVIGLVRSVWPRLEPQLAVEVRWLAVGSLGALLPALAGCPAAVCCSCPAS